MAQPAIKVTHFYKNDRLGRRRSVWHIVFNGMRLGAFSSSRAAICALTIRKVDFEEAKKIVEAAKKRG